MAHIFLFFNCQILIHDLQVGQPYLPLFFFSLVVYTPWVRVFWHELFTAVCIWTGTRFWLPVRKRKRPLPGVTNFILMYICKASQTTHALALFSSWLMVYASSPGGPDQILLSALLTTELGCDSFHSSHLHLEQVPVLRYKLSFLPLCFKALTFDHLK